VLLADEKPPGRGTAGAYQSEQHEDDDKPFHGQGRFMDWAVSWAGPLLEIGARQDLTKRRRSPMLEISMLIRD
jgi:hypothetical protein